MCTGIGYTTCTTSTVGWGTIVNEWCFLPQTALEKYHIYMNTKSCICLTCHCSYKILYESEACICCILSCYSVTFLRCVYFLLHSITLSVLIIWINICLKFCVLDTILSTGTTGTCTLIGNDAGNDVLLRSAGGWWFNLWPREAKDVKIWSSAALLSAQYITVTDWLAGSESG